MIYHKHAGFINISNWKTKDLHFIEMAHCMLNNMLTQLLFVIPLEFQPAPDKVISLSYGI